MGLDFYTLSNGIRLVHREVSSPVAHLGLYINAGSRDETESELGLAHFIEHVIFKGTTRRKVYHILSRLENVGGDLNAFTTKEETCIYASFLNQYYHRTIELFADILINSVFPEKELKKEKSVIIDEINSYKDSPDDQIFDDFEEILFRDHPLGRNILGNKKQIKKFTRNDILKFIKANYNTQQMVISSVGSIPFKRLVSQIERYFLIIPESDHEVKRVAFSGYTPGHKIIRKSTYQTHCMMGNVAYSYADERRIPAALLTNILGGPGMNSRLNLSIREKYGLTYNIESNYTPYSDTGIFSIYLGTVNGTLDRTIGYIKEELKKLREKKLGILQLSTSRQQLIGQLAIAYESNLSRMLSAGKSMLIWDRVLDLPETVRLIEQITAETLIEVANDILRPERLSMLTYLSR